MLAVDRHQTRPALHLDLDTPDILTMSSIATTTQTSTSLKRRYEPETPPNGIVSDSPSKRHQQGKQVTDVFPTPLATPTIEQLEDELTHQEVLLLHGPKQRYMHTERHQVPKLKDESEMLVRVEVVGLNPIDWKAP
jgi:primosomal protein N'